LQKTKITLTNWLTKKAKNSTKLLRKFIIDIYMAIWLNLIIWAKDNKDFFLQKIDSKANRGPSNKHEKIIPPNRSSKP
jgi:hypothetical protein